MHFDYVLHDARAVRISFSNMYKETKVSPYMQVLMCVEHEWNLGADTRWKPAGWQMVHSECECGGVARDT